MSRNSSGTKFELKQWQLNLGLVLGLTLVALALVSILFGVNLMTVFEVGLQAFGYIFLSVGVVIALPWAIGFLVKHWLMPELDWKVDPDNSFGWAIHLLVAIVGGFIVGALGMLVVNVMVQWPIMSQWPWEMIRWPAVYETFPWGWGIYIWLSTAAGYGISAMIDG